MIETLSCGLNLRLQKCSNHKLLLNGLQDFHLRGLRGEIKAHLGRRLTVQERINNGG